MLHILASIAAIQVLIMIVGLLRAKVLSVLLGPAGFGVIATIDQTVSTVVALSALSLPFTAMKFMARSHSQSHEAFQRTFSSFLRALTAPAIGAVVVTTGVLVWRPGLLGQDVAVYRNYLALALLSVPALMLNILFVNTFAAAQAAGKSARLSLAFTATMAAAAIGGASVSGIGGLYLASVIAGLAATVLTVRHLGRQLKLQISTSSSLSVLDELKTNPEIASYSALLYLALASYSLALLCARYVVFSSLGEREAGILQAQLSIALTIGAIVTSMSNLYLAPQLNRQAPMKEKAASADEFAAKISLLLFLGALPFVLFPHLALSALFSAEFAAGARFLYVFILWQCLYQIANVYLQLLIGLDDVLFLTVLVCGVYLGAGALFPVVVPLFGGAGAAVALVAAMLIAGGAAALRLRFRFGFRIAGRIWARAAGTLAGIAATGYLFQAQGEFTPAGLMTRGAYAAALAVLVWVGLTREERGLIMGRPQQVLP